MKLTLSLSIINLIFVITLAIYLNTIELPQIASPQSFVAGISTPITNNTNYIKMGFVPYWNLNKINFNELNALTHIAYFGIAIDDNGQIQTHLADKTSELGFHRLTHPSTYQLTEDKHTHNILVIRAFSESSITEAINPINQNLLIAKLIEIAKQYNFQGFNIDFEPPGDLSQQASNLTSFTKNLTNACKSQIPNCHMSIDVYGSAAINPRIWELSELAKSVDHVVVMGYDYFYASSPNAGPTAPMYGSPNRWKYDIHGSINKFLEHLKPNQLILAVPWYGYEWTTLAPTPGSVALKTGVTATYSRVQELLSLCHKINCITSFDQDSLTPYIIYTKGNSIQQIWYDDRTSLSYKYDLIKQWNLAGTAIWAIGYEYPYTNLWTQLRIELP